MKQIILYEILEKLWAKPRVMRKVKVFAVVGAVGFLIIGSLLIWAGISAVNSVVTSANQVMQSPLARGHVKSIKTELKSLPKLQVITCWKKAQSLLAAQPWLERPALDNLTNLKVACFEQ